MLSGLSTRRKTIIAILLVMVALSTILFTHNVTAYPNTPINDHIAVILWKTIYAFNSPASDIKYLSKLHEKSDSLAQAKCIACHGYMRESRKVPENSALGTNVHFHLFLAVGNFKCITCHKTTGVYSAARIDGKEVVIGKTIMKDGWSYGEKKVAYESALRTNKVLCIECHDGKNSGKLAWPNKHTEKEWLSRHGKASREDKRLCIQCHKKAFCDDCHGIKPVSHGENWREIHAKSYKTRPEYCRGCHGSDYCNERCHNSHSPNFINDHGVLVKEKGSTFCMSCHYIGYCHNCHLQMKPSALVNDQALDENQ
jgi:hypothetical protein